MSQDYVKQSEVSVSNGEVRIGSARIGDTELASVLKVSPKSINAITENLNLTGNLNVSGQIKTLAMNAVDANISSLRSKIITAGSVDASAISADIATVKKLVNNQAFIDNAVVKAANIRDVSALRLTSGQVQVALNGISNSVQLTPSGLETLSSGVRTSLLDRHGHRFYEKDRYTGRIGTGHIINRPDLRGLTFTLAPEGEYMAFSYRDTDEQETNDVALMWSRGNSKWDKGFTFNADVKFHNGIKTSELIPYQQNYSTDKLYMFGAKLGGDSGVFLMRNNDDGAGIHFGINKVSLMGNHSSQDAVSTFEIGQNATRGYARGWAIYNWTTSKTNNSVVMDNNGYLQRSTSSKRYKYHNKYYYYY